MGSGGGDVGSGFSRTGTSAYVASGFSRTGSRVIVSLMRAALLSIVVVGTVSQLAAQGLPFPPPKTPPVKSVVRDSQHPVVVEGCLRGSRLKIDRSTANVVADSLQASEYVLEGRKELLEQIRREHDGHQDEIAGIAILPASRAERDTETTQLGPKTRVTVGARSGSDVRADGFSPVRLKVESLRHINETCSIPG